MRHLACHRRQPINRAAMQLRGLGAVDLTQYLNVGSMVQQANAAMNQLYSQISANPGIFSSTTMDMISDLQARLSAIEQAYNTVYQTATGQLPSWVSMSGFSGLGRGRRVRGSNGQLSYLGASYFAWSVLIVTLAGVTVAVYEWNKSKNTAAAQVAVELQRAQTAGQQANNNAYAEQQMQVAQTAGDPAGVAAWAAVIASNDAAIAAPPPGSGSLTDILTNNWVWLAAGVGALFLASEL